MRENSVSDHKASFFLVVKMLTIYCELLKKVSALSSFQITGTIHCIWSMLR